MTRFGKAFTVAFHAPLALPTPPRRQFGQLHQGLG